MLGKIIKISSNDLYGNVDDREVVVFAAFTHLRYMNKYIIFSFKGEYEKNKLYYGSLHLKDDSLVVFGADNSALPPINTFITNYLDKFVNVNEYQVIDISAFNKIELISYNNMDFDKLAILDSLSIPKEEKKVTEAKPAGSKKTSLYVILFLIIAIGIGGAYVYFNADTLLPELRKIECTMSGYDNSINANYTSIVNVKFDKEELVRNNKVTKTYTFTAIDEYLNFKDNDMHLKYFPNTATFKYNDNNKELKIDYSSDTITGKANEVKKDLTQEGYTCTEGVYRG